jgi:predicted acyl esterase
MTDGAKLAADIYLPQSGGPFPAILVQTPYDKGKMNPGLIEAMKGGKDSFGFFKSTNYAVVVVDWRGKFASRDNPPGKPVVQGGLDGYDCVEWVAKQPWCNGKVGTWGSSALGSVQFKTAARKPPHLAAIAPRVAEYDKRYERYYTGGVERKEYIDALTLIGWAATGQGVRRHPLNDGFYDTASIVNPRDILTPMLLVGGWYDIHDLPRVFNEFMSRGNVAAKKDFRLLIGPFTHEGVAEDKPQGQMTYPGTGIFTREEQRKFFDWWLLGDETSARSAPRVTYYQMGRNEWRFSETWPPPSVKKVEWYVQPSGGLGQPMSGDSKPDTFKSDPHNPVPTVGGNNLNRWTLITGPADQRQKVETHPDVLIYTTAVLTEDLSVTGEIEARLFVSTDSEDTDIAIRITDVYPDGRSMLVGDSIQRLRLPSPYRVERSIVPGQVYEVAVRTPATAHTFLKGHQLRLVVSGSNYPRYALNGNSRSGPPKVATNLLYHDREHLSSVILPIIPG